MGFISKWIQALNVPVDETTGAIRVTGSDGGGGDPVGLKDAAGTAINPATKEAVEKLTPDYVVSAVYTATVGATAALPAAFTATLPAGVLRILLVPRGDVYWAIGGAASGSTAKVPSGGLNLPVTKAVADTIQVFASSVVCDLIVCIARA